MTIMLLRRGEVEALGATPAPARRGLRTAPTRRDGWGRAGRGLLAATAIVGLALFVLGGGNRFTRGPLFLYIPEIELVPPLGRAAWQQAFAIHQQSPLFALCGGYQVGGMESLTVYQLLYLWEWLRAGSLIVFCVLGMSLVGLAVRYVTTNPARQSLAPLLGVSLLGGGFLLLRYFADHAGLFAGINVGQHRHALDVMFASLGLALLFVAVLPGGGSIIVRIGWAIPLMLDIGFGALTEAMDAGAQWRTFAFYADGVLPGPDRLFAFAPVWRNFFENGYFIQATHRVLSFSLWLAALVWLSSGVLRGRRCGQAAVLFGLLTLEGVLGAVMLALGEPIALSIPHQVLAIVVLAVALAPPALGPAYGSHNKSATAA